DGVRLDSGATIRCVLRGRHLAVACGDNVRVALGAEGEGAIDAVEPRRTLFFRSDTHREKLLAANVTQVLGIVAPDPPYDDALVQRWIIAAASNDCAFALIGNKSDVTAFAAITPSIDACRALAPRSIPVAAE